MNRAITYSRLMDHKALNGFRRSLSGLAGLLSMFLLVFLLSSTAASGQAALNGISDAIKSGNAKALSANFDATVEVTILDKEGSYSRSQAEVVVRNFFTKNEPKNFRIIHKGDSGGNSKYAIGKLDTSSGTFRTYIYVKNKDGQMMIQQLRFERE